MKVSDLSDHLAALPQYLLPKRLLTVLAGKGATLRAGWVTRVVIRWYIAHYGVNMAEAADPDPATCTSFNHFFTRALCDGARPLASAEFVSPVDGLVTFSVDHWWATNSCKPRGNSYSCLALIHVPGDLFSVNPATVRGVPGLFARNERVVCVFESIHGLFVVTLVGATIVGSIATVWHGVVNPPRPRVMREWRYEDQAFALRRGQEMGRFLIGSTVVMLFPKNTLRLQADWMTARIVRMGEAMG